jgi:hypothetical protein
MGDRLGKCFLQTRRRKAQAAQPPWHGQGSCRVLPPAEHRCEGLQLFRRKGVDAIGMTSIAIQHCYSSTVTQWKKPKETLRTSL